MSKNFFKDGIWQGSGLLQLSMFEEKLPLTAKFIVSLDHFDSEEIHFTAEYKVSGYSETLINFYHLKEFYKKSFHCTFENDTWGIVDGIGFVERDYIGIEYRKNHAGFLGYESFQFLDDGSFILSSEFVTNSELRSELTVTMSKKPALLSSWKD